MTETIPSSRPRRTISKRITTPILLFVFLAASAFTSPGSVAIMGADNAEMMQLRDYITGYAQNFLGLKYRYAGTSPTTGFDCSGFTSYILKEFDVKVSSSSLRQSAQGMKIRLNEVMPGDLVFFGRKGHIQHVAMVVERSVEGVFCVHSTCSRGIIVENISKSKYWAPKVMFARDVITQQMFR